MSGETNIGELQELDRRHYLHPFSDHKQIGERGTRIITRGEGVYIYDAQGNKILDGMSGLWCVNLGYGRKELIEAAYQQLKTLPYYNSFFQCTHAARDRAGRRCWPKSRRRHFEHVFYTNSGSEANDTIIRMVRRYWDIQGKPKKKDDHQPQERLPRQHHRRHQPRRHAGAAGAGRPADSRHRAHRAAVLVRARAAACTRTSSA